MKKILVAVVVGCRLAAGSGGGFDLAHGPAQGRRRRPRRKTKWCSWISPARTGAAGASNSTRKRCPRPKFADYAKSHLELVVVDFPNKKPQSDALKAANKALASEVRRGRLSDLRRAERRRQGNRAPGRLSPGGPEAFIAKLEGFDKNNFHEAISRRGANSPRLFFASNGILPR